MEIAKIQQLHMDIMEMFKKNECSRVKAMFILESVKMSLNEEITRDLIEQMKYNRNIPGVS